MNLLPLYFCPFLKLSLKYHVTDSFSVKVLIIYTRNRNTLWRYKQQFLASTEWSKENRDSLYP